MYFLTKRNQVSFLLIIAFVSGNVFTAAQTPPPVYARVSMLKVNAGKHAEFEQFMKDTMKPVHVLRREKGKIFLWILFRVHFSGDRKSTRLNSSHLVISYAVFCLKKKTNE